MTDATTDENRTCPLGDDCDLTVAWMAGRADLLEELAAVKAERDRLREALRPFAEVLSVYRCFAEHQLILLCEDNPKGRRLAHLLPDQFANARAALEDTTYG